MQENIIVYVVQAYEYDYSVIIGIYRNKEDADAHARYKQAELDKLVVGYEVTVEQHELK